MPSPNDSADDSTDGSESQALRCITTFDPDDDRPSEEVVTAVAALLEVDPVDLVPLYDIVDPEALDALVDTARRATDDGTHQVWFRYEGFDVGVRSDGEIRIRDAVAGS